MHLSQKHADLKFANMEFKYYVHRLVYTTVY